LKGRIKAGEGTLIGNAGEYYVMAELLKRGVVAALAPRNSPSFDILATRKRKSVRIRVKTKSEDMPDWQYNAKKDGSIFRDMGTKNDFTVLVDLASKTINLKYYVVPTKIINKWLVDSHNEWLATPGKKGQPHSPSNKKRHLSYDSNKDELDKKYHDMWSSLWK